MSQIYNENTESLKLGILGILSREFMHCWKLSRGPQVQERAAGDMYLWEYTQNLLHLSPKSCPDFS